MAEVGSAYVSILPSARGFGRKLEGDVSGEMRASGSRMGGILGGALKVGALAAVGGALLAGRFLKGAVEEAREAQVVTARTENVIRSMGLAGKVSATQIADLAGAISAKTGIDDEAIQAGQNLLLTFKNIASSAGESNGVFAQASRLMVDLSAGMGKDAKGAAIQLGKALNDPVKGVTALTRTGIQFTEQQKAQIAGFVETGQVAKAQAIILREVQAQFGGAAEAMATPADKARVAYDNLKEQIGTALLPVIDRLLNAFVAATPAISAAIAGIGPAFAAVQAFLAPVFAQISGFFGGGGGGGLVAGITAFAAAVSANFLPVLQTMSATFTGSALPALQSFASYLVGSLGPVVSQVFGIIRDQVVPILASFAQFLYGTVYPAIVQIVSTVAGKLKPVFDQLVATFRADVLPTLQKLLAKFQEWQPAIQMVIAVVIKVIGKVAEFAAVILSKVLPPVIRFAGFLISNLVPAFIACIEFTAKIIIKIIEFGQAVVDRVKDVAKFVSGLKDKFNEAVAFIKGIPGKVVAALGSLATTFYNKGVELIQGLINGISAKIGDIKAKMGEVASAIGGFLPGSPVKEGPLTSWNKGGAGRRLMDVLAKGIDDGKPAVVAAVGAVSLEISDHFEKLREQLETKRDAIKGVLDGLKSDFASLRDGIASAFTGNLFEAGTGFDFLKNLITQRSGLQSLKVAFKKLLGYGLSPQFLSQLFASGNGALILDLAAGPKSTALQGQQLFGEVNALGQSLGSAVARNEFGPEIDRVVNKLDRIEKTLRTLPKDFGREINGAATNGHKNRRAA